MQWVFRFLISMLIEPIQGNSVSPVALFLFAHQDDEFGVFQSLLDEIEAGRRVCCAYLTDGSTSRVTPGRRNRESIAVLSRLGVARQNIFFAGEALGIQDGSLPLELERAKTWLLNWWCSAGRLEVVYAPAWEGGHHDHDALHALTAVVAFGRNQLSVVRQYPLYNSDRCYGLLFRVMSPLLANGPVLRRRIPWKNRGLFLWLCLGYPSQALTWLGLFPFVALHLMGPGTQDTQGVCTKRLGQRPHKGPLYYERRAFFSWDKMVKCLSRLHSTLTPTC